MTASVAVPAEADCLAIARAAGQADVSWPSVRYADGRLYVEGVTQQALDEAAGAVGTGPVQGVPPSVTPRQTRLALHAAGLLEAIETALASAPEATRIEWEFATVIERHSPLLLSIAGGLGLTDAQVDDLFRAAAAL